VFVAIQLIISGPTNALPSMNLLTSSAKVRLLQFTRQCNNSIKVRWENCSFFRFIRGVASIAIDRNGGTLRLIASRLMMMMLLPKIIKIGQCGTHFFETRCVQNSKACNLDQCGHMISLNFVLPLQTLFPGNCFFLSAHPVYLLTIVPSGIKYPSILTSFTVRRGDKGSIVL